MAIPVIMPKQGQSVESCLITKWHKKEGDSVNAGDLLFSYETDKAAFEEEAKETGVLLSILAEEGEDVPCLQTVAIIGEKDEDISAYSKSPQKEEKKKEETIIGVEAQTNIQYKSTALQKDGHVSISPRAKAAAERQGIDFKNIASSGPEGRIIERDIYNFSGKAETMQTEGPDDYTDEKLSTVRKVISSVMHESLSTMAQLTNHSSFDASGIMNFRKRVKENPEDFDMADITLNDMILFAVSRVIKNHPVLNAHFLTDKIRCFNTVNLGVAVDTPRGLLVPTLMEADKKSLTEISLESKRLIGMAQTGKIAPDLLENGTFTVTNLGSIGVEIFTPIINPPQTAILGVCTIITRVKEKDGKAFYYPAMGLSLTYDHRAVDGAPAARFIKELKETLENIEDLK